MEIKYNVLKRTSNSELRIEAGVMFNKAVSSKITATSKYTYNGQTGSASDRTTQTPNDRLLLNLGLEYVLWTQDQPSLWADLRYQLSVGTDKSMGPMLALGFGI